MIKQDTKIPSLTLMAKSYSVQKEIDLKDAMDVLCSLLIRGWTRMEIYEYLKGKGVIINDR